MKKITFGFIAVALGVASVSCEHKELCYDHPHYNQVNVIIHWDRPEDMPAQGMRTNLDLTEGNYRVGLNDMPSEGGKITVLPQNSYRALCYDYLGGGSIYFREEEHFDQAEIYTAQASRASYTKLYPDEKLIQQPDDFFMDKVDRFEVVRPPSINELHFYPKNRVERYTFEIRGVKGGEYISAFAGACSGISRSYYLSKESISDDPYTVLIYEAKANREKQTIEGEFRIFGHCRNQQIPHRFTLEIAFAPDGYKYHTWDVTQQMHSGSHHLIMDWNIEISKPSNAGMEVIVVPWDEVWIPMEM